MIPTACQVGWDIGPNLLAFLLAAVAGAVSVVAASHTVTSNTSAVVTALHKALGTGQLRGTLTGSVQDKEVTP